MESKINSRLAERFTQVFRDNIWEDGESVSGPGSRKDSDSVKTSIRVLDYVLKHMHIRSVNDIPCGDFNWMADIMTRYPEISYTGFDIVEPLIERNKSLHPDFEFHCFDITRKVPPKADLIFTKELFIHLKYQDITDSIRNMKESGSKYILSLNHFDCENAELEHDAGGYCRPFNLCCAPFNFPTPLWQYSYFGLWEAENLRLPLWVRR